jgi:hypothetical protein
MEYFMRASRFVLYVYAIGLAACSSGGGNGGNSVSDPVTPPIVSPPPATASVGAAQQAYLGGMPLPQADASTTAFANNLPTSNISFPLLESVLQADTGKLSGIQLTDGASLTRTGSAIATNRATGVYDLKIPGLNIVATGLLADGSLTTLPDGRKVAATFTGLNYSVLGTWAVPSQQVQLAPTILGWPFPGTRVQPSHCRLSVQRHMSVARRREPPQVRLSVLYSFRLDRAFRTRVRCKATPT